jgi:hypothetical protein
MSVTADLLRAAKDIPENNSRTVSFSVTDSLLVMAATGQYSIRARRATDTTGEHFLW